MDQFDRGSRRRLAEGTVPHRLAGDQRDREHARLMGHMEDGTSGRRLLLAIVLITVLVALALAVYLEVAQPDVERPVVADEPAWGTATDETTLVRPPVWWTIEPQP